MAPVLVVYGTNEGHTGLVVERIASALRDAGQDVETHDAREVSKQLLSGSYDGILVGGSIHAGEYQGSLKEFAKRNRALLESVPSAFFSVSLAAADSDEEAKAEIESEVAKFARETGWQPKQVVPIAGALVYTHYNFFIRHMMKLIVKKHGRTELDTSRDYDFTDWDAVDRFAREFASGLKRS